MNRREALLAGAGVILSARGVFGREGQELIGQQTPVLGLKHWLNSPPLEMSDLRGKVVLLRWWTQGCPYCEATAPALIDLQKVYGGKGLQVIGVYHPKPPGNWDMKAVTAAAQEKHFTFPIALDGDWSALKRWWLFKERDFTSVSFLVDQRGIIRYVHPGGEFHEGQSGEMASHEACNRELHFIRNEIALLVS